MLLSVPCIILCRVGGMREERSLNFVDYGATENILGNSKLQSDSTPVGSKNISTSAMCIAKSAVELI